jgi:hypothetical protein
LAKAGEGPAVRHPGLHFYRRLRRSIAAAPIATSASVAGLPAVAAASAPLLGATAQ